MDTLGQFSVRNIYNNIIYLILLPVINTTHNVSQKLCLAAARVLRRVSAIAEDTDTSLDLETVTYLLEDTNIAHTQHRNKISSELAGRNTQSGNV